MPRELESLELFGGCGGLALGLARAGFRAREFVEYAENAVATVQYNVQRGVRHVRDWKVIGADVRGIDWRPHRGDLALVAGGPPCQPFGIGGKKRGANDPRDMWPEAIRAVREAWPTAFLFENVRNLSGPRFRPYLNWITTRLTHVGINNGYDDQPIEDVIARLSHRRPTYLTSVSVVNAADYGAPQVRYRVLIAGLNADLGMEPEHPSPTHSRDALLWDQWVTGDYWVRHGMRMPRDRAIPERLENVVGRLRASETRPKLRPWVTLRDAIHDLGDPDGRNNHVHQHGARAYAGHTGSPLDLPAKALKAGAHGVPGGENMVVLDDGSVRYFTLRESARLVGLPDDYAFCRSWTESMRCLGNAVPTQLGEAAGRWIGRLLARASGEMTDKPAHRRRAA